MLNKGSIDRAMSLGVWAWIAILKDEKLSVSGEVALKNLEHDLKYFSEDCNNESISNRLKAIKIVEEERDNYLKELNDFKDRDKEAGQLFLNQFKLNKGKND